MRIVSQYLQGIEGVEIYPLISFIIFFTFFLMIIFWVVKADKDHMQKMAEFTLDADDNLEKPETLKS